MNLRTLAPWARKPLPVKKQDEQSLQVLHRDVNALFNELFRGFEATPWQLNEEVFGDYVPNIDMHETEKEIVMSVELPGMEEKDISISISKDVLTVSGEKKSEKEEEVKGHYKLERTYGMFRRSVMLPADIKTDESDATFKNGVLTITLPKNTEAAKNSTAIPIKKG